MGCDLCGKDSELFSANIEGTVLTVCKGCASYGKILKKAVLPSQRVKKQKTIVAEPEIIEEIVSDFAERIRTAREKRKLTQKEFAKVVAEKESIVHKLETGNFEPSIPLAQKLERALNIQLIEEVTDQKNKTTSSKQSDSFTLGDFIKVRKRT